MHSLIKLPKFFVFALTLLKTSNRRVVENPDPEDGAEEPLMEVGGSDGLDASIEALLRDWHHSPDLLFSIHPVDGSFLIWWVHQICLGI